MVSWFGYLVEKREFPLDIQNIGVYYGVSPRGTGQFIIATFFLLSVLKLIFVEMPAYMLKFNIRVIFALCLCLMALVSIADVLTVQFVCPGSRQQILFNNMIQANWYVKINAKEYKDVMSQTYKKTGLSKIKSNTLIHYIFS